MNTKELLEVLGQWTNVSTVVGCLVAGYVLNQYLDKNNKHIPLIMAVLGIGVSVALNGYVSVEITIISGALSGLASTGVHQVFHQYLKGDKEEVDAEYFDIYKEDE